MVKLSNAAQAARNLAEKPEAPTAPQGSALARNQVLAQLGATPGTAPQGAAAAQAVQPALKDFPKELGLPAKDVTAKAADSATATQAVPVTAGAVATRAADDAPKADASAPHAPDTRMLDKVVHEARWMISNRKQEVTMRLEPENLGQLKLHVTQKDGTLHVELTVDTAAAKHLLDSSMSQLRERFQQENLAQGQLLHVDVRQGGNSEFGQQFARQGSEAPAGSAAPGVAHAEEPGHAAPRAAWSNSNVSIYA
jgi:flagellar hook-length control protein FliK